MPFFRNKLHFNNPHLASRAKRGGSASSLVWTLALLIYTYAVAISVRRSVPPCQCALTSTDRTESSPRLEYREENGCDPVRWALWGREKPNTLESTTEELFFASAQKSSGEETLENGGKKKNPAVMVTGHTNNRQAHENPHASKVANRFKFFGGKRGKSQYEPDRIAYTTFFAGTGDIIRMQSNITAEGRKDLRNGVFVEIGAGDGEQNSLSLFFEKELNWTGLLIEGATPNAAKLKETRKRKPSTLRVLNAVCANARSVNMIGNGDSAGFEESMSPEEKKEGGKVWDSKWQKPYKVSCLRLAEVLKTSNISAVDLMTIDVKATDVANILQGLDFNAVSIKILMLNLPEAKVTNETDRPRESEARQVLLSKDFCLAARVGSLEFWARDSELRKQHCGWASFYAHP